MADHQHTDQNEFPNCALAEKILDVLRNDKAADPITHLTALTMVTHSILLNISSDQMDEDAADDQPVQGTA